MKSEERHKIISLMSYKHSMLCKVVSCLLILTFTITNLAYGFDRSDLSHLRRTREANIEEIHAEFGRDVDGRPLQNGEIDSKRKSGDPIQLKVIIFCVNTAFDILYTIFKLLLRRSDVPISLEAAADRAKREIAKIMSEGSFNRRVRTFILRSLDRPFVLQDRLHDVYQEMFESVVFTTERGGYRLRWTEPYTTADRAEEAAHYDIIYNNTAIGSFGLDVRSTDAQGNRITLYHEVGIHEDHQGQYLPSKLLELLKDARPPQISIVLTQAIDNIPTLVQLNNALPEDMRTDVQSILDRYNAEFAEGDYIDRMVWEVSRGRDVAQLNINYCNAVNRGYTTPPDVLRNTKMGRLLCHFSEDISVHFDEEGDSFTMDAVLEAEEDIRGGPESARQDGAEDELAGMAPDSYQFKPNRWFKIRTIFSTLALASIPLIFSGCAKSMQEYPPAVQLFIFLISLPPIVITTFLVITCAVPYVTYCVRLHKLCNINDFKLMYALDDSDFQALIELNDGRAIALLLEEAKRDYCDDNRARRIIAALTALGATHDQIVDIRIARLRYHPYSSIKSLRELGDKRAIQPMTDGINQISTVDLLDWAIEALVALDATPEQLLAAWLSALNNRLNRVGSLNKEILLRAIGGLVELGNERAVESLCNALSYPDLDVYNAVIEALHGLGATNEQLLQGYLAALRSLDASVVRSAAGTLSELNDMRAVGPLNELLKNNEMRGAHVAALRTLGQLGNDHAQTEVEIIDQLVSRLEAGEMPADYAEERAIPVVRKAVENLEEFRLAIDMGIRLVEAGIPCCDIIEVGVPLIKEGADPSAFKSNLGLLRIGERLWTERAELIQWVSPQEEHKIHRRFIRQVLLPVIQAMDTPDDVAKAVAMLLAITEKRDVLHLWETVEQVGKICQGSFDIPILETVEHSEKLGESIYLAKAIRLASRPKSLRRKTAKYERRRFFGSRGREADTGISNTGAAPHPEVNRAIFELIAQRPELRGHEERVEELRKRLERGEDIAPDEDLPIEPDMIMHTKQIGPVEIIVLDTGGRGYLYEDGDGDRHEEHAGRRRNRVYVHEGASRETVYHGVVELIVRRIRPEIAEDFGPDSSMATKTYHGYARRKAPSLEIDHFNNQPRVSEENFGQVRDIIWEKYRKLTEGGLDRYLSDPRAFLEDMAQELRVQWAVIEESEEKFGLAEKYFTDIFDGIVHVSRKEYMKFTSHAQDKENLESLGIEGPGVYILSFGELGRSVHVGFDIQRQSRYALYCILHNSMELLCEDYGVKDPTFSFLLGHPCLDLFEQDMRFARELGCLDQVVETRLGELRYKEGRYSAAGPFTPVARKVQKLLNAARDGTLFQSSASYSQMLRDEDAGGGQGEAADHQNIGLVVPAATTVIFAIAGYFAYSAIENASLQLVKNAFGALSAASFIVAGVFAVLVISFSIAILIQLILKIIERTRGRSLIDEEVVCASINKRLAERGIHDARVESIPIKRFWHIFKIAYVEGGTLYINPYLFRCLPEFAKRAIIIHEIVHLRGRKGLIGEVIAYWKTFEALMYFLLTVNPLRPFTNLVGGAIGKREIFRSVSAGPTYRLYSHMTIDRFRNMVERIKRDKGGEITPADEAELREFADALIELDGSTEMLQQTETARDVGYVYCSEAADEACRILKRFNPVQITKSKFVDERRIPSTIFGLNKYIYGRFISPVAAHIYVVIKVAGEDFAVDLSAGQFLMRRAMDYRDLGVFIVPMVDLDKYSWPYTMGQVIPKSELQGAEDEPAGMTPDTSGVSPSGPSPQKIHKLIPQLEILGYEVFVVDGSDLTGKELWEWIQRFTVSLGFNDVHTTALKGHPQQYTTTADKGLSNAAFELACNAPHTGIDWPIVILVRKISEGENVGVEFVARDVGVGIPDIKEVMESGVSTAEIGREGRGLGLPTARDYMVHGGFGTFSVESGGQKVVYAESGIIYEGSSNVTRGTKVTARCFLQPIQKRGKETTELSGVGPDSEGEPASEEDEPAGMTPETMTMDDIALAEGAVEGEVRSITREEAQEELMRDVAMLLKLNPEDVKGRHFEGSVDKDILATYPKMVTEWWSTLQRFFPEATFGNVVPNGKGVIRIICSKEKRDEEVTAAAYPEEIGRGEVTVNNLNIAHQLMGSLNIAFAASNIPDLDNEEWAVDYESFLEFINEQHYLLTGRDLLTRDEILSFTKGDRDKIVSVIRKIREILINIPPVQKIDYNEDMEQDMAIEALRAV